MTICQENISRFFPFCEYVEENTLGSLKTPVCVITNSDLNRPCFAWHPYGKSGLFKTELVIVQVFLFMWNKVKDINNVNLSTWNKDT